MKRIKLTKGQYALVDDGDFAWLNHFNWCASWGSRNRKFYAVRRVHKNERHIYKKARISMHQMIMWPLQEGKVVDHKNDNGLDNRRDNLQFLTEAENMMKSPGWRKSAFSGVDY